MGFPLPETLVKTLATNLVKNLAKNLIKNRPTNGPKTDLFKGFWLKIRLFKKFDGAFLQFSKCFP